MAVPTGRPGAGPVTGAQLVEKLVTGEMTRTAPVAPAGRARLPAPGGRGGLPGARGPRGGQGARGVDARRAAQRRCANGCSAERRGGVLVAARWASAAWRVARYAAVHGPGRRRGRVRGHQHGAAHHPPRPGPRGRRGALRVPRPTTRAAGDGAARHQPSRLRRTAGQDGRGPASAAPTKPAAPGRQRLHGSGRPADGQQFDQAAINRVVTATSARSSAACKEEAERRPGLAAKIPIEFVIGNDGRVAKLWVDNPQFKQGPLYECLLRELQKWPFKPYEGERATVGAVVQHRQAAGRATFLLTLPGVAIQRPCPRVRRRSRSSRRRRSQRPPGTFRHTVLLAAKRFKSTWAELGKLLVQVRDEAKFEEWGYASFEAYCLKELHIQKQTALKLTRSLRLPRQARAREALKQRGRSPSGARLRGGGGAGGRRGARAALAHRVQVHPRQHLEPGEARHRAEAGVRRALPPARPRAAAGERPAAPAGPGGAEARQRAGGLPRRSRRPSPSGPPPWPKTWRSSRRA